MKYCFLPLVCCFLATTMLWGQPAEKVLRITESQRSGVYYKQQAEAWQSRLAKNDKHADAWLNYFTAARYSNIFNEGEKYDLEKIVDNANQSIGQTFEASYLKYWVKPWADEAFGHLQKAYALDPSRTETYHEFMTHYLREGNKAKYNEFCKKHFASVANSPGLLSWNYNAMVNLDEHAVLLTEGDNDTFFAWTLQEAKDFRKDVLVVNTNLLMSEDYRAQIFKQLGLSSLAQKDMDRTTYRMAMVEHIIKHGNRPVYFGIGTREEMRDIYEDDLYLVGLSFKYATTPVDEVAILKKSYENDFLWDHIKMPMSNDPHQPELDRFSRCYLPGLMKLFANYKQNNFMQKAEELKKLILIIGEKSNSLEETKRTLAKY